ncbi:MAG: ribonuclease P protein component [Longimicrobiales bacterium]
MPAARRITDGRAIRSLLRRGRRSKTGHLDVFDSGSPAVFSRIGLVVARHRRSAVERNRLKRRLREILRREILPKLERDVEVGPRDVLVRARAEAYEASFEELRTELLAWLEG